MSARTTPELTIFTIPKPFVDGHISLIQRNAIQAIQRLGPAVELILFGDEPGIAEAADEFGLRCLPEIGRNAHGTPLVSSAFELARRHSASPWLCCINADILLLPDFLPAVRRVAELAAGRPFLAVGQRRDLDITTPLDWSEGWQDRLRADILGRGVLRGPTAIDYFVFPRTAYTEMPPLAIGRAGWDNWMIFRSRWLKYLTVDLTPSVVVGHQNHDYRHLPGGVMPHRLPETAENIRLGGGRRTIFTLQDVPYSLSNGQLQAPALDPERRKRQIETWPLTALHSFALAEVFFAAMYPQRAYSEWYQRLAGWKRRLLRR